MSQDVSITIVSEKQLCQCAIVPVSLCASKPLVQYDNCVSMTIVSVRPLCQYTIVSVCHCVSMPSCQYVIVPIGHCFVDFFICVILDQYKSNEHYHCQYASNKYANRDNAEMSVR